MVPLFLPAEVGMNLTVAVHELALDIVAPTQLSVGLNSEEETFIELMTRSDLPPLVIVTAPSGASVVKLRDFVLTTIFGVLVPEAFCGFAGEDEV